MKQGLRFSWILAGALMIAVTACQPVERKSDPDATNPPQTYDREQLNDLNK